MPSDSLAPEETVSTTIPITDEVATRTIDTEIHQKMPMEQAAKGSSLTASTLASLVEACTPTDSLCEDTCVISADSINDEMTLEKVVAMPLRSLLLHTVAPIEDIVVVEDVSDDEEVVSQVTIEDPIFLITIEDNSMHSMTEVNEEVIPIGCNPLHSTTEINKEVHKLIEDPSIIAASSSMATTMEENDLTCPPIHPPSPLITTGTPKQVL